MSLSDRLHHTITSPLPVAFDIETSGLRWWRDTVGVVSAAWGSDDDEQWATRNVDVALSVIQERMDNGLPCVFHNSAFDLHFLQKRGLRVRWGTVHDTLLMARLINNLGDNELKRLGLTELGVEPEKQDAVKAWLRKNKVTNGRPSTYLDVPDNILLPYAADDTRLTIMLYWTLKGRVPADLYQRELRLRQIMFDAETEGIEIDETLTEQRLEQALQEQRYLESKLYVIRGGEINLDSNPQLAEWLYNDLGLSPVTTTPTGQPQVNEFNLASNPHPVTRLLITRNKRVKAAEFFQSYLDFQDELHLLHPSINTMQARTHRFSCNAPNLQQIPARNDRFRTREVFTSGDGWFAAADYDKQELFIAACEAGETALMADLAAGNDVYTDIARAMLNKQSITPAERQAAKIAVLSMLYGAGAPKVAESFTLNTGRPYTVGQAKVIRANFKAAYPGLSALMDRMQTAGRTKGYLINRWGRKLYVNPERAYVATDYLVQSSGRDVLADAILNVQGILPAFGGRIVIPIHDELVYWFPEEPNANVLGQIEEAMTSYKFDLPLTVSPKKGRTLLAVK